MEKHIGETMEAVISGVTGWGFYAELPNTVEGLVPVSSLRSDYFIFDEEMFKYIKYKIQTNCINFNNLYEITEGLENKIIK